jgi:hypothetical protein
MDEIICMQGIDKWPVSVKIFTEKEKLVRLTDLPKTMKQKAWDEIKASSPALARLLKDQALRDIVDRFSADIFVDASHAPCLPMERLRGRNG